MSGRNSEDSLLARAAQCLDHAHAPYSGHRAGAALRLKDGRIFAGCTVENPAYAQGCEALETASGMMVADGWTQTGALPEIAEAVICYESIGEKFGWRPAAGTMAMLALFGTPETALSFATGEGIFRAVKLRDIAFPAEAHFLNRDNYPAIARRRDRDERKSFSPAFADGPLAKLFETRLQAFCPVSLYAVGSMVETETGEIFYGCNVETGTNTCLHAENNAIGAMVAALGPAARIARVTVLTAGNPGYPCGDCRQRIYEFATADTEIIAMNTAGRRETASFRKLFPHSFGRADLDSAHGSDEAA